MHSIYFVGNRSVNGNLKTVVRGKKAKSPRNDRKGSPGSEKKCAVSKLIPEEPTSSGYKHKIGV